MISIVVHGGAWGIPDELVDAHRDGVARALRVGWGMLQSGASSVDVVEQVITILEDDETFDAGRGSHLNAVGQVELDASIMHGGTLRAGAVAGVHNIRHPIALCRKVMEKSEHILLIGSGAERFAMEHGIPLCDPSDLLIDRELKKWKAAQTETPVSTKEAFRNVTEGVDTVGAVVMDVHGDVCVGTSTGGTFNKYPGRVGDSPLIGCGSYADNAVGGVSTTGWGEAMIKIVMAKTVIDRMEWNHGDVGEAAKWGIELLFRKVDGYGGVIALNAKGEVGIAFNTPRMARGYMNEQISSPVIAV